MSTIKNPKHRRRPLLCAVLTAAQLLIGAHVGAAQTVATSATPGAGTTTTLAGGSPPSATISLTRYVDQEAGMTAGEAVAYALAHNSELAAVRSEVEAAQALVRQASSRPNPRVDVSGSRQINGKDNSSMVTGMLPLELGGRRAARVAVAERELEMRELEVADRERNLAADVRAKYGEALAAVLKLGFDEDLVSASQRGYKLVVARVIEGRTAPLEQNMILVEVNRLRSVREAGEGNAEVAMLELRNLMGMLPEEPLRLRGDFGDLIGALPLLAEATEGALAHRPDLLVARAAERLADAQIEQARATGRLDASLTAGYQRMNSGFPVNGITDAGQLRPVQSVFHFLTFGVSLELPVRNKNQGAIEAAMAQRDAAARRREFAELTVRREVAAAYARYASAARAAEIYRVGVRDQANRNLDVVRQTYELGSKTLIDYIGEQRRFIELENSYIDALLDTYRARVEVERAAAAPISTTPEVTQR
jgi:cobalt-zinc-cadmium efflux system outer membrane protein